MHDADYATQVKESADTPVCASNCVDGVTTMGNTCPLCSIRSSTNYLVAVRSYINTN